MTFHLTGPALRFFDTSCSLQPARQVNGVVQRGQLRILTRLFAFQNDQRLLGYRPTSALRSCALRPSRPKDATQSVQPAEVRTTDTSSRRVGRGAGLWKETIIASHPVSMEKVGSPGFFFRPKRHFRPCESILALVAAARTTCNPSPRR